MLDDDDVERVLTKMAMMTNDPARIAGNTQVFGLGDAAAAVAALQRGVERYPHHSRLLADLATAHDGAEQTEPARAVADKALRQDDLNRRLGHTDKLLPDNLRQRLMKMSDRSLDSAVDEKPN